MSDEALSEQFQALYTEWGDAIANQRHEWLDGFFTDDFLGTAQPWPTLNVVADACVLSGRDWGGAAACSATAGDPINALASKTSNSS